KICMPSPWPAAASWLAPGARAASEATVRSAAPFRQCEASAGALPGRSNGDPCRIPGPTWLVVPLELVIEDEFFGVEQRPQDVFGSALATRACHEHLLH